MIKQISLIVFLVLLSACQVHQDAEKIKYPLISKENASSSPHHKEDLNKFENKFVLKKERSISSTSSKYPYWPDYKITPLEEIKPQEWRNQSDIIYGWDWSHPPSVKPSKRSLMGLNRYFGFKAKIQKMDPQFPVNGVILLWIDWKSIEPSEGNYRWDLILKRIQEANKNGSDVILRLLTSSKARKVKGVLSEKNGCAPIWLKKYNIPKYIGPKVGANDNYDPGHPEFHKRYLKLIQSMAKTEIPNLVKAAYVGYASPSLGDEYIGPYGKDVDTVKHVIERLDAWHQAFEGMEYKVFMGGPSEYGFNKGFGARRGFVEKYLYTLPDKNIGQSIDQEGYVIVDESSPILKRNPFHGEVNEEYEIEWTTKYRNYRFGKTTESYPYRYFCANLRLLQMRCSYVHNKDTIYPELLPFVALQLGRTIENTPDVWCFLRESYIDANHYKRKDFKNRQISDSEKMNGIPAKNWERWLYQRDRPGFETEATLKIEQPPNMWMVHDGKEYDCIARKGKKIGLTVDPRWLINHKNNEVAIKITYLDDSAGNMLVHYNTSRGKQVASIPLIEDDELKTATLFVKDLSLKRESDFNHEENHFDLEFEHSENEITLSFVRIIKL
jgi:hypothetical protein